MKNNKNKNLAFTLIELLVVIVIIGILSGVGIASYNQYVKTARDTKIIAECKQIERCETLITTCPEGGDSEDQCNNLCDTDQLTCNLYLPESEWTDASFFTFSGGVIQDYNTAGGNNIVIPMTINGVNVTSIDRFGFSNNSINSVTIPPTITNLRWAAFYQNNISSVVIPNSVTIIENGTFRYNNLTSVNISNSIIEIGDYAFTGNQLTSVIVPDSVTDIGYYSFSGNPLTSISIKTGTNYYPNSFPSTCTLANGCITQRP